MWAAVSSTGEAFEYEAARFQAQAIVSIISFDVRFRNLVCFSTPTTGVRKGSENNGMS